MSLTENVIEGTLKPDGTLELDQKPSLSPGRVTVVLRQEAEVKPPLKDNWFQCLQAIRRKREAEGYPFMHSEDVNAYLGWLREGDCIDEFLREIAESQGKSEK